TRAVSQNILVAQLCTDLRSDVRQLVYILYREGAPAAEFRDFIEQRGAVEFFWSPAPRPKWVKYADRVQLSIRLAHKALDIVFVVSTAVISPVGYDEQRAFGILSGPHLAEGQIYRIKKRSAAFR